MSQGKERSREAVNPPVFVAGYTQAELDAAVKQAVDEAVKFINECNLRQAEVIEGLQKKIAELNASVQQQQQTTVAAEIPPAEAQ